MTVDQPPLTPPECDLRDFPRMAVDTTRLFASSFNSAASRQPLAWMVGHKLWYRSWHQVPAASLPDDDEQLCHLAELGFDLKSFKKIKAVAMRGWVKASDGRLYHPVVAELALEAWLEKLTQRISSGAGNAKRWKTAFDANGLEEQIAASVALLQSLNPASRAIARSQRRASQRHPDGTTPGQPPGDPPGLPKSSRSNRKGEGEGDIYSVANATGGKPPEIDPVKAIFDSGSRLLTDTGTDPKQARSILGRWRKQVNDAEVLAAIADARRLGISQPVEWITKRLASARLDEGLRSEAIARLAAMPPPLPNQGYDA